MLVHQPNDRDVSASAAMSTAVRQSLSAHVSAAATSRTARCCGLLGSSKDRPMSTSALRSTSAPPTGSRWTAGREGGAVAEALFTRLDPIVADALTDASHAQRFAEAYGGVELKYHHRRGLWLVYEEPRWRNDA